MNNKLINILYPSASGGEFFGSLLTEHKDVVTKKVRYNKVIERWFLESNDWASQRPEVINSDDPRKGVIKNREKQNWDRHLWNLRCDHGYGFNKWTDFWKDYIWNEWKQTKTIIFNVNTEEGLRYIRTLGRIKLGVNPPNINVDMITSMIPDNHDYIIIDPYQLMHINDETTKENLDKIVDYLGISKYLINEWLLRTSVYRMNNQNLINRTIV